MAHDGHHDVFPARVSRGRVPGLKDPAIGMPHGLPPKTQAYAWALDDSFLSQLPLPYLLKLWIYPHLAKVTQGTAIPLRTRRVAAPALPGTPRPAADRAEHVRALCLPVASRGRGVFAVFEPTLHHTYPSIQRHIDFPHLSSTIAPVYSLAWFMWLPRLPLQRKVLP